MRNSFLCVLLFIKSFTAFTQQNVPASRDAQMNYLKKSKHLQTAATVVLLSGPVLVVGPLLIVSAAKKGGNATMGIVYGTVMAGLLSLPVSIGLFIVSSSIKKKAMRLSFKSESVPQFKYTGIANRLIPSLSLKISL